MYYPAAIALTLAAKCPYFPTPIGGIAMRTLGLR
ncbi:hypothetical protein ABH894_000206 [Paenibacillus sp. RC62]